MTLADALAQSCNVYFFHHVDAARRRAARWIGPSRFGFGEPTGADLPDEAAGQLPALDQLRQDSQVQAFAVGQGAFTATPLQIVRLYAAIANGGHLLTPRITRDRAAAPSGRARSSPTVFPKARGSPGSTRPRSTRCARACGAWSTIRSGTAYRHGALAGRGDRRQDRHGRNRRRASRPRLVRRLRARRRATLCVRRRARARRQRSRSRRSRGPQRHRADAQLGYFGHEESADKAIPPGKG